MSLPIAVSATYRDQRCEGTFDRESGGLTIDTPPFGGQAFSSPTAAAVAFVRHVNPDRNRPQTNGWTFWRVAATGELLASVRESDR